MSHSQKVVVIDYGTSNLRSVAKALEHVAGRYTRVMVTGNLAEVRAADRVVFPGQGAIGQCMQHLKQQGLDDCIRACIAEKPFLGICLGLQSLMDSSDEDGGTDGLAICKGKVVRFCDPGPGADGEHYKIPHMGWNRVRQETAHPLWKDIDDGSRFYFVHSYYVVPGETSIIAGSTDYISTFTSAIATGNIFACQFHPEKSQHAGLQLLKNFLDWKI